MKVESDKRIRLMALALMTTELNSSEKQRSHRHHPLYLETEDFIEESELHFHELERLLRDVTPSYFLFTYILSHSWPDLEPVAFPPFLERYEPNLCRSGVNMELREVVRGGTLENIWESQAPKWKEIEKDAALAFAGSTIDSTIAGFFGRLEANLVFAPNPLFPELVSLGAAGYEGLYCIARYPGKATSKWPYEPGVTAPCEEFSGYSENRVWSRIVAFHEFCHPLIDPFLSRNAELVRGLRETPFAKGVLASYGEKYTSWEDMFTEFVIYGMTYAYLLEEFGEKIAKSFHNTMQEKTGFTMTEMVGKQLHTHLIASRDRSGNTLESRLVEIFSNLT
ncbi:MAG TPA: DUF4932 domain-containing protein [Mesotoga infera]|uniref:DUF4932 domain-containing protein n=1 Tax=Mesotoga infera TaxID=1236046 RepID=A0A7C1CTW5_9BACT|nr:DUF4932 domain-containing protein [Mesotoga infera]